MANDIRRQFGERIRKLRKKRGWKLIELSVETDRGRVFLSNLENGKHEPKLGTIKKLADAFGMTISQLMKGL
ncbi:MAG: helix-turn-helix domain-containing protein [Acidobacteriia bacterium]|nr:helix-turn-helix domain-containing protein [Terriglobia bacterium]